ncbi:MAG: PEP-utilizing enzyme [Rhodobacteraceae bacterium]|nr:PEP-utilizing enzyme [Paracoccaceae bacterium]
MAPDQQDQDRDERSRKLLRGLRDLLDKVNDGQTRLDQIATMIANTVGTDVCSIYLLRDANTLELCATDGLNSEAVHVTRMRLGEGLVGRVAEKMKPINTASAPDEAGFRYMPETGEKAYSSFLGVPLMQHGEPLGVLVVQSAEARKFTEVETTTLEVVAIALADMAELGKFVSAQHSLAAPHTHPAEFKGGIGQEGIAEGRVLLHEPRVVVTNPVAEDPGREIKRLDRALETLRENVDQHTSSLQMHAMPEQLEVVKTYKMLANSRSWVEHMESGIHSGLSAEAAVQAEQSRAYGLLSGADPYLRDRLHDLNDLSNRLLRILTGQGRQHDSEVPENPVLVARSIGPGELLEYGRNLKAVVLEEGSVGSHATIIARAMAIPLLVHVDGIIGEALNGDAIMVDGESGTVYLRPDESVATEVRGRIAMFTKAQERYQKLRDLPATSRDGITVSLHMNAGLMSDLPSMVKSGAEGVGLFRTELRYLAVNRMAFREELAEQYGLVLDSARGRPVCFRTLDIGSDKIISRLNREDEPNPAMGWRAIRVALDHPLGLRLQLEALIRGASGRPLNVMFPMIAESSEFEKAREIFLKALDIERGRGKPIPETVRIGAMLETPSLAFAPDRFFELADFISIGGNDLQQFFFAADRQNERVRSRYSTLSVSYLSLIEHIVHRCVDYDTALSYCGEAAGRPLEAICLAAVGLRKLSMRAAAIGRVKHMIRRVELTAVKAAIDEARAASDSDVRARVSKAVGPALYLNP